MEPEQETEEAQDEVLVMVTACRRGTPNRERAEILRRQALAGEEDQSVPGWDFGP